MNKLRTPPSRSVPPNIEPFSFQDGLAEGMRTRTVCGVSKGDQPMSFKWLKDGDPLSSMLGANVSTLDQYSSLLNIPSLSAAHSGDYTCVASNPAAEVKFTASLQVKGKVKSCHCLQHCTRSCIRFFQNLTMHTYIFIRAIITTIVCPFPVALARSGFAADHQVIVFCTTSFFVFSFISSLFSFGLSLPVPMTKCCFCQTSQLLDLLVLSMLIRPFKSLAISETCRFA